MITKNMFDFPVKIVHSMTGHVYIRPISNLKKFTIDQEETIKKVVFSCGYGTIRNTVKSNFTTIPTCEGMGYRIYQL